MIKLKNADAVIPVVSFHVSEASARPPALSRRKRLLVASLTSAACLCALPSPAVPPPPSLCWPRSSLFKAPLSWTPVPLSPLPWCLYLAVLGVFWVPKVLPTVTARLGTLEARVGHLFICYGGDFAQSRLC